MICGFLIVLLGDCHNLSILVLRTKILASFERFRASLSWTLLHVWVVVEPHLFLPGSRRLIVVLILLVVIIIARDGQIYRIVV